MPDFQNDSVLALSKALFLSDVSNGWGETAPEIGRKCDEVAAVVLEHLGWEYGVGDDANYVWFGPSAEAVARERMRALVGPASLVRRSRAGEWEITP